MGGKQFWGTDEIYYHTKTHVYHGKLKSSYIDPPPERLAVSRFWSGIAVLFSFLEGGYVGALQGEQNHYPPWKASARDGELPCVAHIQSA
jgi:hypothetical protein